jgi:hypothetical protein
MLFQQYFNVFLFSSLFLLKYVFLFQFIYFDYAASCLLYISASSDLVVCSLLSPSHYFLANLLTVWCGVFGGDDSDDSLEGSDPLKWSVG